MGFFREVSAGPHFSLQQAPNHGGGLALSGKRIVFC